MDMSVVHVVVTLLFTVCRSWAQPRLNTVSTTITQTSGYSAVLNCQVYNLDDAKVIWLGPSGMPLTIGRNRITTDKRISLEQPYSVDWNLHIRHVKPSDAGEYICKVDTKPPQTKRVNLQIKVAPTINHALSTKDPLSVVEGEKVTLVCKVSALPAASVMWFYIHPKRPDDKEQPNFPASVTGETITIHDISKEQAGIYECLAFNGVPPTSTKNITVNVEFKPIVSTNYKQIQQLRGKDTILECLIRAYPPEIAIWKRGNKEIEEGERDWKYSPTLYKRSESEFVLSLQIYSLEADDFGNYTCEASNQHGTSSVSVFVEELVIKPSTTTTTTTSTTTKIVTTSTSTMPITSSVTNRTLSSIRTTPNQIKTTTQKGVIIDDGDSSNGDKDPGYNVLTTAVYPISPAEQDPRNRGNCLNWKLSGLAVLVLSLIIM
ncbi:limbic system-associated membrane protein-like [Mytilus californianus]|uniref:limbic system-associated membrane protein-like n=1 Tax=Mytilus californianus TaxID=6549 RepID=UPI00224557A4|nr:limbic system-associated membrane protein-like [Mytilus californianus]